MVAVTGVAPRVDGLQVQVAVIFGAVPEVLRLRQFLIFTPLALNKTVPAVETLTVMVTGDLNAGVVENEIDVTEPIKRPST